MPTVETVRGPVDTADLGPTLMHEHVFVLSTEHLQNYGEDDWWDEDERVAEDRDGGVAHARHEAADRFQPAIGADQHRGRQGPFGSRPGCRYRRREGAAERARTSSGLGGRRPDRSGAVHDRAGDAGGGWEPDARGPTAGDQPRHLALPSEEIRHPGVIGSPAGSAGPMVRAADPVYAGGAVDRFSPKGGVNFNNPVGKRPQKRALMTRIQRAIDATDQVVTAGAAGARSRRGGTGDVGTPERRTGVGVYSVGRADLGG